MATEDKRFYSHDGLDYKRIAGAILNNIKQGRLAEGASTITQQLVKNTQLTQEKTFERKFKEMIMAKKTEKAFDKNTILEMYLNAIYLGGGIYGVGSAAENYFGKDVSNLTLSEAATIAGITRNPSKYNPKTNPENAKNRRNLVLKLMKNQGFITEKQLEEASAEPLETVKTDKKTTSAYVLEAINEACEILNVSKTKLLGGGYEITTALSQNAQSAAESALFNSGNDAESIVILLDNQTSAVTALVSSAKVEVHALKRQIASLAKPILVYAPALESGQISLSSPITDEPTDFDGYAPKNFNDRYYGNVSVKFAISKSLNVPAVKVLDGLGVDVARQYAKKLGLSLSESDTSLSLALGGLTDGLTVTELLGAYSALANGGTFQKPYYVLEIKKDGKTIYRSDGQKTQVFSPETAFLTTVALVETANSGTAKTLSGLGISVAAKTGTNSVGGKNRDAFSAAYTTRHTAICWRGHSDNSPLAQTDTGGGTATKTLYDLFSEIYSSSPPSAFTVPEGVKRVKFDKTDFDGGSLKLAAYNTPEGYFFEEYSNLDYLPEASKTFFEPVPNELTVVAVDGKINVKFRAKKPFEYKLYSVDVFGREEEICCVSNSDEAVEWSFDAEFLKNYYIKCGFVDYFGNFCEGEPQKISSFSAMDLF